MFSIYTLETTRDITPKHRTLAEALYEETMRSEQLARPRRKDPGFSAGIVGTPDSYLDKNSVIWPYILATFPRREDQNTCLMLCQAWLDTPPEETLRFRETGNQVDVFVGDAPAIACIYSPYEETQELETYCPLDFALITRIVREWQQHKNTLTNMKLARLEGELARIGRVA